MADQPADVVVAGNALNDRGFSAFNTIAGLGLNTFGFLWPCDAIWGPTDDSRLVTIWTTTLPAVVNTETCVDTDVGG